MLSDDLLRAILTRLEALEAEQRVHHEARRRRTRLLASAGKLCPVVAVLGLAGWAVGQGVEIKTSDGAADQTRLKVETGAATVSAYFLNTLVGIGTNAPGARLHLAGDSTTAFLVDNGVTFKAKNSAAALENYFWPRWTNDRTYLNYGANGFHIRPNGSGSNANTTMFMDNAKNVGIGTISPDVQLTIASTTTTTDQTLKIYSQADVSLQLVADADNVTETDNPYVLFSQDGDLVRTIIGYVGAADVDPQGGAYTGTANNDFLIGTVTGGDILIGTGGAVDATFFNNGSLHLKAGYANAAVAGAAGSAGFWFGDDTGAQTDPTFTILEDSNDTRCINIGVGASVGVISTGAHDLYIKTGGTEGTINTGTSRIKIDDADGSVEVTSLRGLTLSGANTSNATFGAWPGNAAANTWLYLSNGDTTAPAYSDLAVGDSYSSGLSFHVGQSRFYTKGDTILMEPTSMGNGDIMRIKFVDPDGGSTPVSLEFLDDGSEALGVVGGWLGVGTNNPVAPLDVRGTATYTWSNMRRYADGNGTCADYNASWGPVNALTIYAENSVRAAGFRVESDRRVKNIQGDLAGDSALSDVLKLRPVRFKYVDQVGRGSEVKNGFVAQEVEAVYPDAIVKSSDFVPDIYAFAKDVNPEGGRLVITMEKPHRLSPADTVRILTDGDQTVEKAVQRVLGDTAFEVEWSEGDGEVKGVFVFGRKVDDLRNLDYDQVFTAGIAAIQELAKQNRGLKAELAEACAKIDAQEGRLARLERALAPQGGGR